MLFPDSTGGLQPAEITVAEILKRADTRPLRSASGTSACSRSISPRIRASIPISAFRYSNDMDQTGASCRPTNASAATWMRRSSTSMCRLMRGGDVVERPAQQTTLTRRYTDEGITFIRAHRDQPFFLYLAHNFPHMPLFRSKEFENRSQRGLYGDVVEEIDTNVGRILTTLRDLKLEHNTLVLYMSDNGPGHRIWNREDRQVCCRGAKGSTWEGGMRVPAIFWWPGTIKPGVITGIGSELDMLQTFASLAGRRPPSDRAMDGYDLSPTLTRGDPSPRHTLFYYASTGNGVLSAVRRDSFKAFFVMPAADAASSATPQLYNLDQDPSEKFDLAAKRPETVTELRSSPTITRRRSSPSRTRSRRGHRVRLPHHEVSSETRSAGAVLDCQQPMRAEEAANRAIETFGIDRGRVDVAAMHLDERLVPRARVVQPSPFRDRNHRILGTVQKQDRGVHASIGRIDSNGISINRRIGKKGYCCCPIRHRSRGSFQDQRLRPRPPKRADRDRRSERPSVNHQA